MQGRDACPSADDGEYVSLTAVAPLLPFDAQGVSRRKEWPKSDAHHHPHESCTDRCGSNVSEALAKPLSDDHDHKHADELLRRKLMNIIRQSNDLCNAARRPLVRTLAPQRSQCLSKGCQPERIISCGNNSMHLLVKHSLLPESGKNGCAPRVFSLGFR